LVPKLIQVIPPFRIKPGNQKEARFHLQQRQKPQILRLGCVRSIATEKASMAFELALAVRNKAVQAYQSVMGMQF
jgi:flagellar hook-basal body complex protein FliE